MGLSNITSSVSVLKAVYALRDLNLAVPKSWTPALRGRRVLVGSYRLVASNEVRTNSIPSSQIFLCLLFFHCPTVISFMKRMIYCRPCHPYLCLQATSSPNSWTFNSLFWACVRSNRYFLDKSWRSYQIAKLIFSKHRNEALFSLKIFVFIYTAKRYNSPTNITIRPN